MYFLVSRNGIPLFYSNNLEHAKDLISRLNGHKTSWANFTSETTPPFVILEDESLQWQIQQIPGLIVEQEKC